MLNTVYSKATHEQIFYVRDRLWSFVELFRMVVNSFERTWTLDRYLHNTSSSSSSSMAVSLIYVPTSRRLFCVSLHHIFIYIPLQKEKFVCSILFANTNNYERSRTNTKLLFVGQHWYIYLKHKTYFYTEHFLYKICVVLGVSDYPLIGGEKIGQKQFFAPIYQFPSEKYRSEVSAR